MRESTACGEFRAARSRRPLPIRPGESRTPSGRCLLCFAPLMRSLLCFAPLMRGRLADKIITDTHDNRVVATVKQGDPTSIVVGSHFHIGLLDMLRRALSAHRRVPRYLTDRCRTRHCDKGVVTLAQEHDLITVAREVKVRRRPCVRRIVNLFDLRRPRRTHLQQQGSVRQMPELERTDYSTRKIWFWLAGVKGSEGDWSGTGLLFGARCRGCGGCPSVAANKVRGRRARWFIYRFI